MYNGVGAVGRVLRGGSRSFEIVGKFSLWKGER